MFLLKNRLFTKFVSLSWLKSLGNSLYYIALITYAAQLANPALGILIITVSGQLPLVFDIIIGAMADGVQERVKRVVQTGVVQGLIYMAIGVILMSTNSMGAMLAIGILNGISDLFGSFTGSIVTPFKRFLLKEDELEQGMGLNTAITQSLDSLGGFIGVLLLSFVGIYFLTFFNAVVFFAISVGFKILKKQLDSIENQIPKTEIKNISQLTGQIRKSLKELMRLTELRNFFLLAAAMNSLFMTAVPVFMMVLAENEALQLVDYGFSVTAIKLLFVFVGVVAGVFGPTYFKGFGTSQSLGMAIVCIMGFIVLLNAGFFWAAIAVLMGAAFAAQLFSTRISAFLFQSVPPEILGTVGGCINFVVAAFPVAISTLITSVAAVSLGAYTVLGMAISIGLLVAVWRMKLDKTDFKAVLTAKYVAQ